MPYAELTGLPLVVRDGSVRASTIEIGQTRERTQRGRYSDGHRGIKRAWELDLVLAAGADAEAVGRWLQGRKAWHVAFDGMASDNGLHPLAGYAGRLSLTGALIPGSFAWRGVAGEAFIYRVPLPFGLATSFSIWHRNTGAGSWNHYVVVRTPAGTTRYKNGVVTPGVGAFAVLSANPTSCTWTFNGGQDEFGGAIAENSLDELVLFSWSLNPAQVAALYAQGLALRTVPPLPSHQLRGDILREAPALPAVDGSDAALVRCRTLGERYTQGRLVGAAAWQNNLRVLSVTLEEV